jgi:hypothetical protein
MKKKKKKLKKIIFFNFFFSCIKNYFFFYKIDQYLSEKSLGEASLNNKKNNLVENGENPIYTTQLPSGFLS